MTHNQSTGLGAVLLGTVLMLAVTGVMIRHGIALGFLLAVILGIQLAMASEVVGR